MPDPVTAPPGAPAPPPDASEAPPGVAGAVPAAGRGPEALPLGVEFQPTGHPEVDGALGRLVALDGVPTEAHVPVYEDVHRRLGETLAALDHT
ncbi:hypothetical protein [Kitasatospora sp. NPDC057015]|uniref:hypothetical protein n=1 Tax=Kitasatospora sp. NPDC057015 TaxID=3346001 RepID=UPI00363FC15D